MSYERTPENNEEQGKRMESWWASLTPEQYKIECEKRRQGMKEAIASRTPEEQAEIDAKLSITQTNSWTEERREAQAERMRQYNLKHWAAGDHPAMSEEVKESAKIEAKAFWSDEVKKANLVQTRSNPMKGPNNLETYAFTLIEKVSPGRFKFNPGNLVIGTKIPDFYEKDGGKLLIEIYGDYWHSPDFDGLSDTELVDYYAKLGYTCLVLWEEEVNYGGALWKLKYFLRPKMLVDIEKKVRKLKFAVESFKWPWSTREGR